MSLSLGFGMFPLDWRGRGSKNGGFAWFCYFLRAPYAAEEAAEAPSGEATL